MKPALEQLAVPAPIGADEEDTGPATLAMAAAALGDAEADEVVDRIEATRSAVELAQAALGMGYHVHLFTSTEEDTSEDARRAGLLVHARADVEDVEAALASRHPIVLSAPGDGPPFLLLLREDADELVVHDPSLEERPLTWTWDRLGELLATDPAPRVLAIAPRTRMDR